MEVIDRPIALAHVQLIGKLNGFAQPFAGPLHGLLGRISSSQASSQRRGERAASPVSVLGFHALHLHGVHAAVCLHQGVIRPAAGQVPTFDQHADVHLCGETLRLLDGLL